MKFFVQGGYYDTLEDVARLLLLAARGNQARANLALRRAIKAGVYTKLKKARATDDMLFLAARKIQLKRRAAGKPCSDFTAIKETGRSWRTLYRKYEKRGQTLK